MGLKNPFLFGKIWKLNLNFRVRSSVVERVPDKNEVVGPIPTAPTISRALSSVGRAPHLQ